MTAAAGTREEILAAENAALRGEIAVLRENARAESERVPALLASIQSLHQALYAGSTSAHILRASLDVTSAERGYYVSDEAGSLRVRAVVDVPALVGERPSPFISALCRLVLSSRDTVRWSAEHPPEGLTPGEGERFREGIAVPVSRRGEPAGVIVALDKDGVFYEDEVRSLLSVGTQAGIALENAQLRAQIQHAYVATIGMLADTLEAKDPYTKGHCDQVSQYARHAAERLALSDDEARVACYAALLHDVGKIGVSDGILNKPGPLIPEERRLVQAHVRIGFDLLSSIPALQDVARATLHHHEWFDGSGYPDGLAGDHIPIASRIVAVVDAYCAMLDKRSYKEAYTPEHAREELRRCAGSQFDPAIVEAVLAAIQEVDAAADGASGHDGCGILPGVAQRLKREIPLPRSR